MKNVKRVILQIEASRAYGRSLLAGIAEYSKRYGPWAFYHEEPFYTNQIFKSLKQIIAWKPDGMIVRSPRDAEKLRDSGIPVVIAIHIENDIAGIPNVKGDNPGMGQIAAEHLLKLGFREFGFCGLTNMFWSNDRCQAFKKTINEAGLEPHIFAPTKKQISINSDQKLLVEWLSSIPKPIAVMACNDDRASQLIEAAKIAEVRIPDDMAVLGVDNDEVICDLCYPSLSSIKLNNVRAGYESAKLLDEMMEGQEPETNRIIVAPIGVVTRQSTDIYCVHDREIADALRFIRENSREMIQVSDVAEHVCLSKRTLQLRFRSSLGYSVHERIKKEKINRMAELLTETNMSIIEIALNLGFSNINHISRFFKQEKGLSPLAYRRRYSMK